MNNSKLSFDARRFSLYDLALLVGPIKGGDGEGENDEGATGGTDGAAGDPNKKITALTEEKDRHYAKRKDAEQKATELQRERDELAKWKEDQENAKKSDIEKLQGKVDELTKANTDLQVTIDRLAVENAFHLANNVEWHNPKRALGMLDLSDVKVENGKVDADKIKKKIEQLAKDEPYLVKSGGEEGDGASGSGSNGNSSNGAGSGGKKTGTPPGKQKAGAGTGRDVESLAKKYPALRGRFGNKS